MDRNGSSDAAPVWAGRFLDALRRGMGAREAARVAGVTTSRVYRLRRTDPDFARRWYEALAEGYDNLEMELLQQLRSSPSPDKQKFDTATALRCLTAHPVKPGARWHRASN